VLAASSVALPHRLHKGESLSFDVAGFQPGEWVVRITAVIDYSFDGQAALHQRLVSWRASPQKAATAKTIVTYGLTEPE
jgi:hypothetical protein